MADARYSTLPHGFEDPMTTTSTPSTLVVTSSTPHHGSRLYVLFPILTMAFCQCSLLDIMSLAYLFNISIKLYGSYMCINGFYTIWKFNREATLLKYLIIDRSI